MLMSLLTASLPTIPAACKTIEEVLKVDRGYLTWLLAQKLESDQIDEDWIYTLKHHLEK